jgi:hypothetical protein
MCAPRRGLTAVLGLLHDALGESIAIIDEAALDGQDR